MGHFLPGGAMATRSRATLTVSYLLQWKSRDLRFEFRRRAAMPMPVKPGSSIAHVDGSGTTCSVAPPVPEPVSLVFKK